MSRCLVLHAEAMSALGGRSTKRQREVRAAMSAAFRLGREVVVPAVVLAAAGVGSTFMVDAHVVAAAVELGGGVVLTADAGDLRKLSAPYRNVTVVDIG